MEILSRAWQTDLALLESSGSLIEQHGTYLVVRTPGNPGYHWGNFVLLRRTPMRRDLPAWEQVFAAALPDATHFAFGVDDPEGDLRSLRPFADAGYRLEVSAVMTAGVVTPPRHVSTQAEIRQLKTGADWEQRVTLSIEADGDSSRAYRDFLVRKAAAERAMSEAGRGEWFGAFLEGEMVAGLGIFTAGAGVARFQEVVTHPRHRERGFAGTLVFRAGQHALADLGATTLVIVADPGHPAYRVYEGVGFTRTETQLQAIKLPRR